MPSSSRLSHRPKPKVGGGSCPAAAVRPAARCGPSGARRTPGQRWQRSVAQCGGRQTAHGILSGASPHPPKPAVAVGTYFRVCERCGFVPDPRTISDLVERSALLLDLRLCGREALEASCQLLREAPSGIRQVVLCDGLVSLGSDPAYRERVEAQRRRRQQPGALAAPALRLLVNALAAFVDVRGTQVSALDLAGVPLGHELPCLLNPLATSLRSCRTRSLQWLSLSGCRLHDRGLSMLLPWLAGPENAVPSLQALLLARNGLVDVHLVDALLRARARLCFERRAAPLQLLDLSGNPRLCEPMLTAPRLSAAPGPQRCRGGDRSVSRMGACTRSRGRCTALTSTLARALAEGLPLQVLRLQHMHLRDDSLQPLLRLLQAEARRCLLSAGTMAGASGFCLQQLDLHGNPLSPVLQEAAADAVQMLVSIRLHAFNGFALQGKDDVAAPAKEEAQESAQHVDAATQVQVVMLEPDEVLPESPQQLMQSQQARLVRSSSQPEFQHTPLELELLVRDAISDVGEVEAEEEEDDGWLRSREAFLLQRAEDQRKFRVAAKAFAFRTPIQQISAAPPAQASESCSDSSVAPFAEAHEDTPITIAGTLGICEAQTWVRQCLLDELREGIDGSWAGGYERSTSLQSEQVEPAHVQPLAPAAVATPWPLQQACGLALPRLWEGFDLGPLSAASSLNAGEAAEADRLLAERLGALRSDVLGALAVRHDEEPEGPQICVSHGEELLCMNFGENLPPQLGELADARLDDMHREALSQLCDRMVARGLLPDVDSHTGDCEQLTPKQLHRTIV